MVAAEALARDRVGVSASISRNWSVSALRIAAVACAVCSGRVSIRFCISWRKLSRSVAVCRAASRMPREV